MSDGTQNLGGPILAEDDNPSAGSDTPAEAQGAAATTEAESPPADGQKKGKGFKQRKREKHDVHGWVVLDKPVGMTSTHAVAVIKRLFKAKRAGHAGTLDPLASGCLPVALGEEIGRASCGEKV